MKRSVSLLLLTLVVSLALVSTMASAANNSTISLTSADSRVIMGQNNVFTITNTNATYDLTEVKFSDSSAQFELTYALSTPFTLAKGDSRTISFNATNPSTLSVDRYDFSLIATGLLNGELVQNNLPLTLYKGLCSADGGLGPRGTNLSIKSVDISNSGDKDEEWKLLDEIDLEIKVENNGADTIDDVRVEVVLLDSNGDDVTGDLDFSNADDEEIDLGNIREDDDKTATFHFKVSSDIETGNYRLAVRAFSDGNENEDCVDRASTSELDHEVYHAIEVIEEDDEDKLVAIDDVTFSLSEFTCGETASGSLEVVNVGDDEQEQVLVTMTSKDFGLNEQFEIKQNLDRGDSRSLDFSFVIPQNVRDGNYPLQFRTSYDFDDDEYDTTSDEVYTSMLKVIGCSGTGTGTGSNSGSGNLDDVDVSPTLKSSAQAGSKLVVDAIITNAGSQPVTLALDASGYQSWAKLDSVSSRTLSLDAGDSETVTFTFTVDDTAVGAQSFTLQARGNGDSISQPVEVNLESKSGGFNFSGNASLLWIIGIINVVLIVLIIIVAVRLSRR